MKTTFTMTLEPGEIVRIPFPFSSMLAAKQRPVLVLSKPDDRGDFLCMAVTSKGHHARSICIGSGELKAGALPVTSWIRADKVFTLDATAIVSRLAVVVDATLEQALDELCLHVAPGRR